MTDRIGRSQTRWLLLVIAVVGFAFAVISYGYLIANNCDSSGAVRLTLRRARLPYPGRVFSVTVAA